MNKFVTRLQVFSNYMKWCKAMGVAPCFSKMNPLSVTGPPAAVSRVVDLVLYFCIWGEGANLRHMPECLWFIYHKMMESYCRYEGYTQTRSLYAGHFLDQVISPIFTIIKSVRTCW
jgi:callose synthase